jgi:ribosomal-protein-alanine N-acetyltransferase
MAFLRATTPFESPVISGVGLFLRTPSIADYPAWMELRAESRAFLTPWEPTWPADDLTRTAFRRRSGATRPARGPAYPFIFRAATGLVGRLTCQCAARRRPGRQHRLWMGAVRAAAHGRGGRALMPFAVLGCMPGRPADQYPSIRLEARLPKAMPVVSASTASAGPSALRPALTIG